MIDVTLRLVARPEKRDELLRRMVDLFGPTRATPGCVRHGFHQEVEDPNVFSFVEEWESSGPLDDRFRSERVSRLLEVVGDLVSQAPEARFDEIRLTGGVEAVDEPRGGVPA